MRFEYLIFNIVVIFGPILVYFFGNKKFVRPKLSPMVTGISVAFTIFVVWDELVTNYFWSFNQKYITGILIGNLPIEEILFFVSVPFACLLLWVNYKKFFNDAISVRLQELLIIICTLLFIALFVYGKIYSSVVFAVFSMVVLLDVLLKTKLFTKKLFLIFIFGITNILTLIFNLYLTARPVVLYNESIKTNINLLTIPMEDFIYGMALIALVIIIYEKVRLRDNPPINR